ncbi:aminoglycoside phosphotransferase [Burkholderia lata]|uniref:Aminoglycoside phosphotransferase n=1 Tax=Burkholderia lata (strain ATCC 17760 / DSM 23089 / LMG 22485 / NCIMB 9086 / R18194 / 383) TaxID=482957 RepID=A0A6P2IP99_BURL3|nr:aminoglycoside phosphotransferase [Burkholderia lata]VWB32794.1 aminoglycoside phosphotransferase [Burkholderia lata]
MDSLAATFDEIRDAYALRRSGPPRQVGERVWHLPTDDGGVAVKLYASEHHARAAKEAAMLAHFEMHGDPRFHVQALKRTAAGASLWTGAHAHAHAMLTRWETGQFRTYDTFSPAEWDALGASLAALHLSLERLHLPQLDTIRARLAAIDADAVRRSLLDALGRAGSNDGAENLRRYVDLALRMLDRYYPGSIDAFPADDPQHPIHNDYNQFNYLFTGTLPPLILDWEASIGAPREYELVRCLNHLPLEAPRLAEAFVLAYRRTRPVDSARIAWAVDAACLQHAVKLWIVQGWLDEPSRFASHLNGAVTMASAMVDARDRLVDFFSRCIEAGR